MAIVQTLDFFPPIVDSPYEFGSIAAANAISDIYAMGGMPIIALNILGFPSNLPKDILGAILKGGYDKAREAGVIVVGGHTIDDEEPKYGMAVTGIIEPGKQITKSEAKPGDVLIITKPIGTGIITTAAKQGIADNAIIQKAIEVMSSLNHNASDVMTKIGANACTDITGYGLIGHLGSILEASSVGAKLTLSDIPMIDGISGLLKQGIAPGGTHNNLLSSQDLVNWSSGISQESKLSLCDAQTSGGLLMSVPSSKSDDMMRELLQAGVPTIAVIGEIVEGPAQIQVVK